MNPIILDASVLAKAFVKEKDSDKAMDIIESYLKGEYNIVISELTIWEVLNALKYHRDFPNEELMKVGEAIYYYGFEIIAINLEFILKSIEIALENDITIYDATYIALTQIYNGKLVTADKKLYNKIHSKYPVELLVR